MEASLATVYLIAFTIWNIRRYFEKKKARQAMQSGRPHINRTFTGLGNVGGRVLDAFRGSLDPLLGATVLMAIVMFVAAIYTAAMGAKKREVPVNLQAIPTGSALYDVSLSFLAGTFSAFPVLLLYALTKQPDRRSEASHRKWLRRVGLVIVWGLGVAETFLAPRGEIDYEVRHEADKAENHIDCDERGGASYWAGLKAAQFLVCAIPGLWIVLTVFLVTGFGSKAVVKNPFVRRFRAVWRLVVAWVNLIIMWLVLLYFTRLRTDIITRADGLDNTDEWGFGQILAVSTWVPAILEFLYILICEHAPFPPRLPLPFPCSPPGYPTATRSGLTDGDLSRTRGLSQRQDARELLRRARHAQRRGRGRAAQRGQDAPHARQHAVRSVGVAPEPLATEGLYG